MCGPTGVGKSSVGNLIILSLDPAVTDLFKVEHDGANSCQMGDYKVGSVTSESSTVYVVDTPGFGDTGWKIF